MSHTSTALIQVTASEPFGLGEVLSFISMKDHSMASTNEAS